MSVKKMQVFAMIRSQFEILKAIVVAHAIHMMHNLFARKQSSDVRFHDEAMLENDTSPNDVNRHISALRLVRHVFLLLLLMPILLTYSTSHADHVATLPGIPTAKMKLAMQRGYITVRFDEGTSAYPNFRAQAWQVLQDHYGQLGIDYVEVFSGTPDVWFTMPEDSQFLSQCGNGAAACITYASSPVVVIAYRRSLLYTLWTSTDGHEMGHLLGLHEQYLDNGQFACKPISQEAYPTVMNCGTGRWQLQPTDVQLVRAVMVPKPLSGFYGMSYSPGRAEAYWCGMDLARATRVAIMAIAPDGTAYWSGVHIPVRLGCISTVIVGEPGWCYEANVENQASWRVGAQRNDTRLGCL